ncbi:outer membrane protein assembly factor [Pedobacter sp. MC2016-14]|uniref:outer membrane protein assembly factor n=1 Tax=Pedobacter sp. MC2016-14 TaxID=2897327 RepID=UPI001E58106D|nr:outer membrane protein assembly factor [Pedobacter sp. MC2016-14]MCD0487678.1 outer membrane protein assembly factor [Pedobacter sp. MC2016-14]
MKIKLILAFLMCAVLNGNAQIKLIKKMLSNELDTTRKASFMPIPVFRYSQETGLEFGAGTLFSMYIDRKDTTNRSSNFSALTSYSTQKQYNITLRGSVWTKANKYHLIGEFKFKRTPFNFYGIGNNTIGLNQDRLVQDLFKVFFETEKNILPFTYIGLSLGYENYSFVDKINGGIFSADPSIIGKSGGSAAFVGISQSFDNRNSNNYPSKGLYAKVAYQYAPKLFSTAEFSGSQFKAVVSNFWPLAKKFVLGVNALYYTIQSSNTPFYLLPQMGNDEMMRGYYAGRYRAENLLAAQTELRYRYSNRFGLVAFAGAGRVFNNGEFSFKGFKPSYGAGGRYFFDPAKGLSVRLDYGIGEKLPNEKRQSGFYISLAEAF